MTHHNILCVLYPIKYLHSLDYKHAQKRCGREASQAYFKVIASFSNKRNNNKIKYIFEVNDCIIFHIADKLVISLFVSLLIIRII